MNIVIYVHFGRLVVFNKPPDVAWSSVQRLEVCNCNESAPGSRVMWSAHVNGQVLLYSNTVYVSV